MIENDQIVSSHKSHRIRWKCRMDRSDLLIMSVKFEIVFLIFFVLILLIAFSFERKTNVSIERKETEKLPLSSSRILSIYLSFPLLPIHSLNCAVIPFHMSIDRIDKKNSGIFNHVSHSKNLFTRVLHKLTTNL